MVGPSVFERLRAGCVIPAHPLALTPESQLDERHQRALTRYYLAAGAGGLAAGVHTTQFAIHNPKVGLYRPVLELAIRTARESVATAGVEPPIMIAGLVGDTAQAVREARLADDLGYHLGLLSLTALRGKSIDDLIEHARQVAEVIPIMGFYLQSTISGMTLPKEFWSRLVEIPNVRAVKIAPFNRYQTLDVLEAVAQSGRKDDIALYTGNDDNILLDLATRYVFRTQQGDVALGMAGGLLGQWACWTKRAVEHLARIKEIRRKDSSIPMDLLTLAGQMTLANKAIFDADHAFAGCIPGISYVLKCQGLMDHIRMLDPADRLSTGQTEQIDEIMRHYPHLTDDEFVAANLETWLAP
ncbi:MAG TPA: dihydrodipicolinate synthase family protein [Sedimentisphaerales bacterium]|jgi:dihydrodipicolinate synthase/N-acetylneuraminate lyase|nr:dihydrodipicolinate synthase family protein [Sedimentisphaerales bacterium]HNU30744.1 dihydrodipicolinate synthase family protein [Sedimentisphaerales bacterium]